MSIRGRAMTRYMRRTHINRKKKIIHDKQDYWAYHYEGMLSKGKIHCSCRMCSAKFSDLPKMQDLRRKTTMDGDYSDYMLDRKEVDIM